MKRTASVVIAAVWAALVVAAPASADPDTDFANELHTYGIYGQKDYNAWIGKITCKRLDNGLDQDADKSAKFVFTQLAKGSTTETVLTTMKLEGSSGAALRQAIAATRRGGVVSVPGVYAGFIHGFLFGDAFEKGLTFKSGQTHAQRFMPELLERISAGDLRPDVIVTHTLPLLDAVRGYEIFNDKQEDCRKVVLRPGAR